MLPIDTFDELLRKLKNQDSVSATKELTRYYTESRFKLSQNDFKLQYCDGKNDGGIDFHHREDSTFYIIQTKFARRPVNSSATDIKNELKKIKNSLLGENTNVMAEEFINIFRKHLNKPESLLEILWLTTNRVKDSTRQEIQKDLDRWKTNKKLNLAVDFIPIDKISLESIIYDIKHGYIPYTGKKKLKLYKGEYLKGEWDNTNVLSIICSVQVSDLLKWFKSEEDINRYLQKNVREFLGMSSNINKSIASSYIDDPHWFWYKHNGIIVFADHIYLDESVPNLVLRNPQIVNGGQTIQALFSAHNKHIAPASNPAKVLLRIYRLPVENTKTYKTSIDIISALNTQNKIKASDLRSTDPRQVRIEQLVNSLGGEFRYHRKRSKAAKSTKFSITMQNLALRYYVCKSQKAHDGVRGNIEELFEEDDKYDYVFKEDALYKELNSNHILIDYLAIWEIDYALNKVQLAKKYKETKKFIKWYILVDAYEKLLVWKKRYFKFKYDLWIDFIKSAHFEEGIKNYAQKHAYKVGYDIMPRTTKEPRAFYRTKNTYKIFQRKTKKSIFNTHIKKAYKLFSRDHSLL